MRSQAAGSRIVRGSGDVVGTIVKRVRVARRDSVARKEARKGPSVQERQTELVRFYERYEDLVETLCDAAQYGPTPKLERSYELHRDRMREEYAALRPYVVGYLSADAGDDGRKNKVTDSFEALVAADTLNQFLGADDGDMIWRITQTREALTLYGEHLRQLAARAA